MYILISNNFALNDQETNRCSFLLTFASEQTIREGYLKAFELAVKGFEGKCNSSNVIPLTGLVQFQAVQTTDF